MVLFLESYYQLTNADDIGALLGSLALLEDGTPADPASWEDWLEAVASARSPEADIRLKIDSAEK